MKEYVNTMYLISYTAKYTTIYVHHPFEVSTNDERVDRFSITNAMYFFFIINPGGRVAMSVSSRSPILFAQV